MSLAATEIRIAKLPRQQASEASARPNKMGLTTEGYIKQLIEDDLALDKKAKTLSLDELAAPFRKALKALPRKILSKSYPRHVHVAETEGGKGNACRSVFEWYWIRTHC